ncbi:acid phosphatase/Vanadium-dependent haloperoxidase [Neocallimastix lanati (nom. inval.)]|jgi:diacylglycerol diphosphate phosphatase/phosphatidate phosphatase|nr:acid phosphatase/Vanadium-dependent haloperoxidase [Neocallimastix sp. JGI-2020a]
MANKDNKALKYVKILFPYVFDWAVIYAIWKIKEYMYNHSKVFERQFSIFDETISHPGKPDTLPWADLLHYTLISCVIIIVVVQLVKRNFTYGLNQAILGLWFSYLVTNLFSDYIKDYAGRYRPDFLYYCDVDFQKVEQQYQYYRNITGGLDLEEYGPRKLFNTTICRGDPSKIASEQKSFPSGHTSFAFTTMIYLTLYLAGQLRIYDGQARGWKYFICCLPIFFAFYVPFSRLMDYRHHWQDCLAGAIIGTVFAVIFYYLFYPSLRDPNCDKPIRRPCNFFNKQKKEKKEKIDEIEEDDEVPKESKPEEIV